MTTLLTFLVLSLLLSIQLVFGFTVLPEAPTSPRIVPNNRIVQKSLGSATASTTTLNSTPNDNEEEDDEGLDLNLEEMFTMFDAADKEVDFDKAIQNVKKESK
jgi:hypothetical protein